MNVDDLIAERIAQARIKAEREKRRRAELAAARRKGLGFRQAAKLRRLAEAAENGTLAASGA